MKKSLLIIGAFLSLTSINAQTHTIDIHAGGRVASLLMTPAEYNSWITNDEYTTSTVREALVQDIYQKFNDDFDFIFLILNESVKPSNLPFGQLIQVSNATSGIGLSNFDNTLDNGSAGKLQALIHLTRIDYLRLGPSLHEIMHNWANFGIPTEFVSALGTGLTSFSFGSHWGFTGGSSKGQLGGFDQNTLVDNGGGTYTVGSFGGNANGGNSIPYTELELYLMGMIPITSVTNFDVFTTITSLADNGNSTFTFDATNRTTYSPTSLGTLLGSRTPSSTSSQKDFKGLVVVLTDAPLTTAQWDQVDDDAEKFSRTSSDGSSSFNFWEATNQLGTLELGNLQTSVGIEELALNNDINLYPNPATNNVTIEFTENNLNIEEISIVNAFGQNVANINTRGLNKKITIDLNEYAKGVYFLAFKSSNKTEVFKKLIIN